MSSAGPSIECLPAECLHEVLTRVPTVRDAAACRLVCHRFKAAVDAPAFWRQRAIDDYKLSEDAVSAWRRWSTVDLYQSLLRKFARAVGLWRRTGNHYGGLLKIEFTELGLCCYELSPPPSTDFLQDRDACEQLRRMGVRLPAADGPVELRRRLAWQLRADTSDSMVLLCHRCDWRRPAEVSRTGVSQLRLSAECVSRWAAYKRPKSAVCIAGLIFDFDTDTMEMRCGCREPMSIADFLSKEYALGVDDNVDAERLIEILRTVADAVFSNGLEIKRRKHVVLSNRILCARALRIKKVEQMEEPEMISIGGKDVPTRDVLPAPGIYAGTYGGHGWEVLHVYHIGIAKRFVVCKISGDDNVPSGRASVAVKLDFFGYAGGYALEDMSVVPPPEPCHSRVDDRDEFWRKAARVPFRVGAAYYCRAHRRIANVDTCWFQFGGMGYISESADVEPTRTPVVFAALDRSTFVVRWMQLRNVSLFCRVHA